jgi:uncharacterized protein YfbU (UPF0304 family)
MRVTPTDRLILMNQYEILNKLDQSSSYENNIKVLRSGFESEIEYLFSGIDEEGLSKNDCGEVIDVLAMFDHLIVSLEKMEDKDGLTERDVTFRGSRPLSDIQMDASTYSASTREPFAVPRLSLAVLSRSVSYSNRRRSTVHKCS